MAWYPFASKEERFEIMFQGILSKTTFDLSLFDVFWFSSLQIFQ